MEAKRLMKVTYQDLKKGIRLNAYADAVIWSEDPSPTLAGLRFGGYAEVVRGLTDAIYGGATIEIEDADGSLLTLKSLSKQYHREVSHEGLYAEATLIAEDEIQESSKSQDEKSSKHAQKDDLFDDNVPQQDIPAHICYIFCHPGNEDELFQAIDQKSYVPMIPEYQDYVLAELKRRRILRPLRVRSLYHSLEPEKGRRLCMTGICRQCGQRLCYGVELPEHEAPECLLAAIYHWCLHLWMVEGFRSAEDERDFRTVFVSLFHKEDQELAQGWLERTETQDAQ